MENTAQINRIMRYESVCDEIKKANEDLKTALAAFASVKAKTVSLEKYYTGRLWKKDFADDEAGLIPKEIKRGVLSEDGVYDLLDEYRSLEKRISKK
ncbi:MAG: DUF4298 domain-containing protein [Clostridia bacterium]|nr:DUF4298 domain-containing protein [Clostridia bacterium]